MPPYSLFISPCPNDTFIFDGLLAGVIPDFPRPSFCYALEDIEALNQRAKKGDADIIKVSYGVVPQLCATYDLLSVGAALGKGVGPLLVANNTNRPQGDTWRVVLPGVDTSAHLLFNLYYEEVLLKKNYPPLEKSFSLFSTISEALQDHKADAGVLIHEGRFTYRKQNLHLLADLGTYWENTRQLPVPLGGIMIKKSIPLPEKLRIQSGIKKSIQYAQKRLPALSPFIRSHAQEMEERVMRAHIELYVNAYSLGLNSTAQHAISSFLQLQGDAKPVFI